MRLRSFPEVAFRLKQEVRNLALFAAPPTLPDSVQPVVPLPDAGSVAEALRGSAAAGEIVRLAEQILRHQFPLLGLEIATGPEIHWRRDHESGKETPDAYFRKIPYLDTARAGDHKLIWELNRHQHLVLLAQAHLLTDRVEFLQEIGSQLERWLAANRFQRGMNWASALEVGFRALSWMWVDHLVGSRLPTPVRRRLIEGLYRHGHHLETNLSVYFSPNTHLLGEAVALHALGVMFRGAPHAPAWESVGARLVAEQLEKQVHADGSHFEQSTSYHVYALDMFLFHAVLANPGGAYRARLTEMARYLDSLMGAARSLPSLGDDDGGRFFHPYGPRDRFGRATLATCGCLLNRPDWIVPEDLPEYAAWWLGPQVLAARDSQAATNAPVRNSLHFPDAGLAIMASEKGTCIVDAGPFGPFGGGHSHADTLSLVARAGDRDLLVDAGTFTYDAASPWRNRFRGTAAHNTIRVGGVDQADPAGAFRWENPPKVSVRLWHTASDVDFLDAECRYRGVRHRRRIFFLKPAMLFIFDEVTCGGDSVEQFWHPAGPVLPIVPLCFRVGGAGTLLLAPGNSAAEESEGGEFGWRSPVYGAKAPSPVIVTSRQGSGNFGTVLVFETSEIPGQVALVTGGDDTRMLLTGAWSASVTFPREGLPRV